MSLAAIFMSKCGLEYSVEDEGRITVRLNIVLCFLIKTALPKTFIKVPLLTTCTAYMICSTGSIEGFYLFSKIRV